MLQDDETAKLLAEQARLHSEFLSAESKGDQERISSEARYLAQNLLAQHMPAQVQRLRRTLQSWELSADSAEDVWQVAAIRLNASIQGKLLLPVMDVRGFAELRILAYFVTIARNAISDLRDAANSDPLFAATVDVETLSEDGDENSELQEFIIQSRQSDEQWDNFMVYAVRLKNVVRKVGEDLDVAPIALAAKLQLDEAASQKELFNIVSELFHAIYADSADVYRRLRRAEKMVNVGKNKSKLSMEVVGQLFDPPISRTAAQKRINAFWSHVQPSLTLSTAW